jgi:hypothetical protein
MVVHVKRANQDLCHMHIAFAELVSLAVDVKLNISHAQQMEDLMIVMDVI